MDKIADIDLWYMRQLARFLEKLEATKDMDGKSLLSNSMIVYGSGNGDGNRHTHSNLPLILAGGGGGSLSAGRYVKFKSKPMSNLFLSMLDRLGVDEVERLGDSTGASKGSNSNRMLCADRQSDPRTTRGPGSRAGRDHIHGRLSDLGQFVVGRVLFFQRLLQHLGDLFVAELLRKGPDGTIAGNLVVFDALGGGDEGRVLDVGFTVRVDRLIPLGDESLHGLAGFTLGRKPQRLKDLFQPGDVLFGLPKVVFEGRPEPVIRRRLGHLGQGLCQPLLRIVKVVELGHEEIIQGIQCQVREETHLFLRCKILASRMSKMAALQGSGMKRPKPR